MVHSFVALFPRCASQQLHYRCVPSGVIFPDVFVGGSEGLKHSGGDVQSHKLCLRCVVSSNWFDSNAPCGLVDEDNATLLVH